MYVYIDKKNDIGRIVKLIRKHDINAPLTEQFIEGVEIIMRYKCIVMQELEDTNVAIPYRIVNDEKRAEQLCQELEDDNPGFIFWSCVCEEEE